jgi:putative addiction module component (TIGR02574 family)
MGQPLTVPPPGFDDLPVAEQIDYVQALWTRIARDQQAVPSPDWHLELVRERLAAHRKDPDRARPWSEVRADLQAILRRRQI